MALAEGPGGLTKALVLGGLRQQGAAAALKEPVVEALVPGGERGVAELGGGVVAASRLGEKGDEVGGRGLGVLVHGCAPWGLPSPRREREGSGWTQVS